jgi:release factor glutamine methyltransferase
MIDVIFAYRQAINELKQAWGETEAVAIARILISHIVGISSHEIPLSKSIILTEKQQSMFDAYLVELKNQKPIQYVIGETEFYGLTLKVNSSVLIPRPETEELVHWVISECSLALSIIDIGTGSGCIPIALAKNLPNAKVSATDISKEALVVATQNARNCKVDIDFIQHNIFTDSSIALKNKPFDVVVSNPPYIRESEKKDMMPNVLEYEPTVALFVSDLDPLLFYRRIALVSKELLKQNGHLFFEINEAFGLETKDMLVELGYGNVQIKKDINGKDRMVKATYSA